MFPKRYYSLANLTKLNERGEQTDYPNVIDRVAIMGIKAPTVIWDHPHMLHTVCSKYYTPMYTLIGEIVYMKSISICRQEDL